MLVLKHYALNCETFLRTFEDSGCCLLAASRRSPGRRGGGGGGGDLVLRGLAEAARLAQLQQIGFQARALCAQLRACGR